jgi:hypothetical protein
MADEPNDEGKTARAAIGLITGPRKASHGKVEENFTQTAQLWSAYLRHEIHPIDVAILMVLFKASRVSNTFENPDNFIDMCGYASLAGFLADKK